MNSSSKPVVLHIAALKGDWESVKNYTMEELTRKITSKEETALHIAASSQKLGFIEKLMGCIGVNHHATQYLETETSNGNTALCYAAASGNVKIAHFMLTAYANANAATPNPLANLGTVKPLSIAAMLGHTDMVKCLLPHMTTAEWTRTELFELFTNCIKINLCGDALKILTKSPELATYRNENDETALMVLGRRPCAFVADSQIGWRSYIPFGDALRSYIPFGAKNKNTISKAVELLQELYPLATVSRDLESGTGNVDVVGQALFAAAMAGNVDFIIELIRYNPEIVWKFDSKIGTIFHVAVQNRCESIFRLSSELGSVLDLVSTYILEGDKNMLHLAAELAPQAHLNMTTGEALQMQRELLWYREIEKVVQPSYRDMKDSEGKTPYMLFIESHKELMVAGEKWMKETAQSSMVVAALIATVMFTTAFTVPGGYKTSGMPAFVNKTYFIIFSVFDALALFTSCTSILMFHSIITSRYTESDFLETLPSRLMIGVASLFASVAGMMVTFCASFLLYYPPHKVPWIFTMFALFACVPILYVSMKYPLLADLIRSAYNSWFMFQSRNQLFS